MKYVKNQAIQYCKNVHQSKTPKLKDLSNLLFYQRQCPTCFTEYLRDEGCHHVKCPNAKCRYEFCEICSGEWSVIHHACVLSQKKDIKDNSKKKSVGCCLIF